MRPAEGPRLPEDPQPDDRDRYFEQRTQPLFGSGSE